MKIVVLDAQTITKGDISLKPLQKFGEVVTYNLTKYEDIAERIKDADAVICNKTLLNSDNLKDANNLKYIGLFATGYNNIDVNYCTEHGITVCNAGSYSTDAVAQHTFALILEHYSNVGKYNDFCHNGGWQTAETFSPFVFPLNEVKGKTIGIVGFGAIGQKVAQIANAFSMKILAFNRSKKNCDYVKFVDFDTLLKNSDIVTVHCPLNDDSTSMFNNDTFNKMKKGSFFINTARGGVMVEEDLIKALESEHLSGAAVDVLSIEPMSKDSSLPHTKNLLITPHIAWAPIETRERLIDIVCDNIDCFIKGTPKNKVN
ncbi:MAG: D-2-hydroxyacid dehydrogenase [Ruminococcaceae bacterium]|nr:D-2-hydroxyacid dehydrogenase [Oscillospiraceae bacterium]